MLTPTQRAALKVFVEADPTLNQIPHSYDGAFALAYALQAIAVPDFIVWRTSVTQDEIMQNGFDWMRVDNLSVGKARIWEWLFDNESAVFNPSKPNVRAGVDECWKGTTADLAVRAAIYVHCKRPANLLEKLFATGDGSDAIPATMTVEGSISYNEAYEAMGW